MIRRAVGVLLAGAVLALPCRFAVAGAQVEEQLSASVRAGLSASLSDLAAPEPIFPSVAAKTAWLTGKAELLAKRMPDVQDRIAFLKTVYYEATRAGLDPELVLGVIQTESNFRKYAVSSAGARGYMQVMPFWVKDIGRPSDDLFHLRTNLRYGCTILRYYLDVERGNLFLALGRYNGSRGQASYPNLVLASWSQWRSMPSGYQVAMK
ncbi:transglycosylase SLT domain-containing protein [Burkholderia multivorans]|uniref:transglycosylase SLT domain-containing protein n=1 Tax=Burkholderia multivorans TaxID=87883 RepID=UPI000CFED9A6|nr:transglycosylase SLT domain-containing protein [Burkholderia multivorans]MBU9122942.1 transglycosylase SLT domain-containing protein [Burkholderia multivorans]MDN7867554.1 transglycosylase SLT domain-containing protein [Burkholderia multivorans]MDR8920791.1 Membrane-bound lytic murein transglycosylase C [Burkholderia multivorans]MDR8926872.1 Membrane-bound lytic murein transglycosylase C [Burkholderia multivorans]MDR8969223.1 Membrane-bound lytic murein transglycosylase C [Burkholderia mult